MDCQGSAAAATFAQDLVFPCWAWTAWLLIDLFEHDFKSMSENMREALHKWCSGWVTTKLNEDAFHHLKLKSRQSERGNLSRPARLALLAKSSLITSYGREELLVSNQDEVNGKEITVDSALFKADLPDTSMDESYFNTLTETTGFPRIQPERFHTAGLRWKAYMQAGSFETLSESWWSMLLPSHMLLCEKTAGEKHKILGLILKSTEFYCLIWKVEVISIEHKLLGLDFSGTPCWEIFLLQVPLERYFLQGVEALTPMQVKGMGHREYRLCFKTAGGKQSILTCAARSGFRGLTVHWMETLFVALGVDLRPRPSREVALATALMKHCLPEASDEDIA
eukprot:1137353-Amphidinium_carterae.1